jgi:hypothetical protein
MRVTVSHDKGLEGAKKIVNDSADQLLKGAATGPVEIADMHRNWQGDQMQFSFTARMGIFSAPIKGFVECRQTEVVVDVELPGKGQGKARRQSTWPADVKRPDSSPGSGAPLAAAD